MLEMVDISPVFSPVFFFFFSIAQGRVIRYLSDKYVSSCIMD